MKKFNKILVIVMAMAVLLAMPMTAFASSGNPYKDVTKKTVGKQAYKAIKYNKSHKVYKDVVKGKKFYPKKKIRRGEFIIMLTNAYGSDKVPVTETDKRKWNKSISAKWACAKMVKVAEKIGISIKWDEKSKKKLTRAHATLYLYSFEKFDSAFRPRQ